MLLRHATGATGTGPPLTGNGAAVPVGCPVVVAVVLTFEALCMASNLISTAPYLSGSGILTVWKDRSGTGFKGETQIMLAIVFFVRVTFYWAEIKIRPRVADYRCAEISNSGVKSNAGPPLWSSTTVSHARRRTVTPRGHVICRLWPYC